MPDGATLRIGHAFFVIIEEIEDEFHFMMECPKYRSLRKEYLYPILLELNKWT